MITVKGNKITFTGKDRTDLIKNAKKFKMTPRQFVLTAVENHARNVIFLDALDKWDEKKRIQGVQLGYDKVKLRREGTD